MNTTTWTWDTANNLATVTYPNSLLSTSQYDSMNRLTSMTASNAGYGYTLGPTGIRTQGMETSGRAVTWSFDGIYRLTSMTASNTGYGYTLGPTGIRTQGMETSGRTVTWSFDGIYRLTGE